MKKQIISSESVTEGHPDKICDQISDAILDEMLKQDKNSRVAVECLTTTGSIHIAGEISTKSYVDVNKIARRTLKEIGYTNPSFGIDSNDAGIWVSIHDQSPDISIGVTKGKGLHKEQGAGDQGMMYGYACNETKELMPLPIMLAHKLAKRLAYVRKKGLIKNVGPDGKSQVSIEYVDGKPKRISAVVISQQHKREYSKIKLKKDIIKKVIEPICKKWIDKKTKIHINPTGAFVIGGPEGDSGLTGRKIVVDTYGGIGRVGGGAFSGKDPSKVDRSGAYMARYVAKNIVKAKLADKCEIQIAYAIGVAKPVSIAIDCFGTEKILEEKIIKLVKKYFDLRPNAIIKKLDLLRPIYKKTAAYGHFGRNDPDFTWEKTDLAITLRKEGGL